YNVLDWDWAIPRNLSFLDKVSLIQSLLLATGGTSDLEKWYYRMRLGTQLGTNDEETCRTYSMLKVLQNLFQVWNGKQLDLVLRHYFPYCTLIMCLEAA
ncbi:hypothetical protein AKJ16_DCAP24287, partial [Drosera capensis]